MEEDKFYNNSSRFNFTSPIFSDMNNLFNLDIYGIKQDIDPNARELNDGFFKAFTNKDFDVQFIMNRGIKISHLTFNVSKEVLQMKKDINIIPILTKYDEKTLNELNPDADYPTESFEQDDLIKLAFGIALNGKPVEDYNIYIIINAYDNDNGRYNIFAGGLKVLSKKEYNDILFKRTFIKFLKGMKRNMDLTIYKLPVRLDDKNPNLREGDFDEIKNINVDLENFQSQGIFTAATTFKIKA